MFFFELFVFQLLKSEIKIFNNGYAKEKVIAKVHMDESLLISDYRVSFWHNRNRRSLNQEILGMLLLNLCRFLSILHI